MVVSSPEASQRQAKHLPRRMSIHKKSNIRKGPNKQKEREIKLTSDLDLESKLLHLISLWQFGVPYDTLQDSCCNKANPLLTVSNNARLKCIRMIYVAAVLSNLGGRVFPLHRSRSITSAWSVSLWRGPNSAQMLRSREFWRVDIIHKWHQTQTSSKFMQQYLSKPSYTVSSQTVHWPSLTGDLTNSNPVHLRQRIQLRSVAQFVDCGTVKYQGMTMEWQRMI